MKRRSPNAPFRVNNTKLPFLIFALIGTLFVLTGAALTVEPARRQTTYARAIGRVVDYVASRGDDGYAYIPVVAFTTPDGRRHEFKSATASAPAEYRLEQEVSVLYNPGDPTDAVIESFMEQWFLPGMFIVLGGIFALIGWIGVVKVKP